MYKISIVLPIFNVENLLERALNSIINQTMDLNDIEVIMVDDCSTDNSREIMEKYSNKYPNFISLYHDENSGCGGFPRNTGLKVASGEYIMFLDPDDEYTPENCEKLYNAIKKYDGDMAFGRFELVYYSQNKNEISYSPFYININDYYPVGLFQNVDSLNDNYLQKTINFFKNENNNSKQSNEIIYAEDLQHKFELLKIPPSVWTKIYKKEFLIENDFYFQKYAAEDLIFVVNTMMKANGIIFLNNFVGYIYYIYDAKDNVSKTNNVNFKLLNELCDSYITCAKSTKEFPRSAKGFYITQHLMNWFFLWKKSDLDIYETNDLIKKLKKLRKILNGSLKTRFHFLYIINYIKIFSYFSKFKK